MTDTLATERPWKTIDELAIGDRIVVRRNSTTNLPQRATVATTPREVGDTGDWAWQVRYDGQDTTTIIERCETALVELDNDIPGAWIDLPAFPGLTVVGQFDVHDGPDESNVLGIWRDDATGQLYCTYASTGDAEVFSDDEISAQDLYRCTADELEMLLHRHLEQSEWMNDPAPYRAEIAQLVARIRSL